MDTQLQYGDFVLDGRGLPVSITGIQEIAQRALIRLTVRRGSFALDPQLGSNLYRLPANSPDIVDQLAFQYVTEALQPMPQLKILQVTCSTRLPYQQLLVTISLQYLTQPLQLTVAVAQ